MNHTHTTREALVQAAAAGNPAATWAHVIQHVLDHGDLRPGWLSSVPDLAALAVSEPAGALLGALEGLRPQPLLALGVDAGQLRRVVEGYLQALEGAADAGGELHVLRLRALCRVGRTAAPQG